MRFQNDEYCKTYTVAEGGGGGGGKAWRISDKFVLILHIFLITMEKYENDKSDFLQTQRIKQLDKYSISIIVQHLPFETRRLPFVRNDC